MSLLVGVDMEEARRVRETTRDHYECALGAPLSYDALIVCACALALREHPALNAHWTKRGLRIMGSINIGLTVAAGSRLLVPVIRDVAARSLREIQTEIIRLLALARGKRLAPELLSGATFTVANLGVLGVGAFVPVIKPPEVAILGVGQVADGVVAVGGQPTVRPMATLCLVFDRRALDGASAAAGLARIKQLLENPFLLAWKPNP